MRPALAGTILCAPCIERPRIPRFPSARRKRAASSPRSRQAAKPARARKRRRKRRWTRSSARASAAHYRSPTTRSPRRRTHWPDSSPRT